MGRDLSGSPNFLSVVTPANLNLVGVSYTIHFWVYPRGSWYIGAWHGSGARAWLFQSTGLGTAFDFLLNDAGGAVLSSGITRSIWTPVGLTWDTSPGTDNAKFWIFGRAAANGNIGDISQNSALEFGRAADAVYSDCKFAEVAIWQGTPLSDADMAALANPTVVATDLATKPTSYWRLYGNASPESDYTDGNPATISGSAPATDHPSDRAAQVAMSRAGHSGMRW